MFIMRLKFQQQGQKKNRQKKDTEIARRKVLKISEQVRLNRLR